MNYQDAGVDQSGADALIPVFAALAKRTWRPELRGEVGGFASGLFHLGGGRALTMSTDGVGTKSELLRERRLHHVAGWDAVAMNVDDVICIGAEPILCVDYVSIYPLDGGVMEAIVAGVADACELAGCALVGGETSQHPGVMPDGSYDVVATVTGIVDVEKLWGPHRVQRGDAIVGIASSGPHSNGFSLLRKLDTQIPDDLLAPTAIYTKRVLSTPDVRAAAHVTGGGIPGNLIRALPDGLGATVRTSNWPRPAWLDWIAAQGVGEDALLDTFNCGLGMLLVVPDGPAAVAALGDDAFVVGDVTDSGALSIA